MTTSVTQSLDQLCIDTIRILSMDAVQKANSGHPGTPMALAPMAYVLWTRHLHHDPRDPGWPDRDRFVLSAGHASMLLYSAAPPHRLRPVARRPQAVPPVGQQDAGPSRVRPTPPGVEVTTGPLGQGVGNAVGHGASPRRTWRRAFNRDGHDVVDHRTYVHRQRRRPDGRRRARGGVARRPPAARQADRPLRRQPHHARRRHRRSRFARTSAQRFEAYGWHVAAASTDGNDLDAHRRGDRGRAAPRPTRPSLIVVRTHIGYGVAEQAGHARGARLAARRGRGRGDQGDARLAGRAARSSCPTPRRSTHFARRLRASAARAAGEWNERVTRYAAAYPGPRPRAASAAGRGELPDGWDADDPDVRRRRRRGSATRVASARC